MANDYAGQPLVFQDDAARSMSITEWFFRGEPNPLARDNTVKGTDGVIVGQGLTLGVTPTGEVYVAGRRAPSYAGGDQQGGAQAAAPAGIPPVLILGAIVAAVMLLK